MLAVWLPQHSAFTWNSRKPNYWVSPTMIRFFFWPFGFIDRTAENLDRKQEWESNLGPLQRGQSLCTWDACSTNWAKRRPYDQIFKMDVYTQVWLKGLWAGSRRTASSSSLIWNHCKKERHCASSLCNYHVHHTRNVQIVASSCSFQMLVS